MMAIMSLCGLIESGCGSSLSSHDGDPGPNRKEKHTHIHYIYNANHADHLITMSATDWGTKREDECSLHNPRFSYYMVRTVG